MSLSIEVRHNDTGAVRIILNGSLDTITAIRLDERFDEIENTGFSVLVIDMGQLQYISSAGLRSIFRIARACKQRNARVAIANQQPQVAKVFDIVKALPDVSVFASEAELDRYLLEMQKRIIEGDG